MRRHARVSIRGNHEDGLLGERELAWFTEAAQAALIWQREQVSRGSIEWMTALPVTHSEEQILFVHGRPPRSNTSYTTSRIETEQAMRSISQQICIVGHSHLPTLHVGRRRSRVDPRMEWQDVPIRVRIPFRFERDQRVLLNPGSVGQPRDGCAASSVAVIDTRRLEIEFRRVSYPIEKTQRRIRDAGLPEHLAARLERGN